MSGAVDPQLASALTPDTPADAVFRWLARTAEAKAQSHDGQSESPPWRRCHNLTLQFAQWSRVLPPFMQGRILAPDVAAAFSILSMGPPNEPENRQVQRSAYRHLGLLLAEQGVEPVGQVFLATGLWAAFGVHALHAALSAKNDPGRAAMRQAAVRAYETAMDLRENIVADLIDMNILGAERLLQQVTPVWPAC